MLGESRVKMPLNAHSADLPERVRNVAKLQACFRGSERHRDTHRGAVGLERLWLHARGVGSG